MTHALALLAQALAAPTRPEDVADAHAGEADSRAAAFDGYELPSHSRPPPVGIPLSYVLEVTTTTCGHCARAAHTSRLYSVDRAGLGTRTLALGSASPVFDRAIRRVNKTAGTPVCLACVEDFLPEPVHYPVPGAILRSGTRPAAAPAPAPRAPRPRLEDFDFS